MPKPDFTPPSEIERIEAPTREFLVENYIKRRRPVILTGVATQMKAYKEWTPDYLRAAAGDSVVTAHYDENADFQQWYDMDDGDREDRQIPLGDLLDLLLADPPDLRYYMTEHALHLISEDLLADVSMSQYISDELKPGVSSGPCLFVGRDISMPAHFHPTTEAFMCQLKGDKKVTLYGPEQCPNLYTTPWHKPTYIFSRIDYQTQRAMAQHDRGRMDFDRWPKLERAKGLEFTVHAGEILFIPVHWWHVTSVDCFQLSMTYFWRSDPARWHYPTPGLRVRARETMRVMTEKWLKLKGLVTGKKTEAGTGAYG